MEWKRFSQLLKLLFAWFVSSTCVYGQDFQRVSQNVDTRLQTSLKELAQLQAQIAAEKIPLAAELSELEKQALDKRREVERLLRLKDSRTIDLGALEKSVKSLEEQSEFISSTLGQFVRDFEGRLDLSELPHYEELTAEAKLAPSNVNLSDEAKLLKQLNLVSAALVRLDSVLGGQSYEGEALDADGVAVQGTFVAAGPAVYFSSADGSLSGLTENRVNAAAPVVVSLPTEFAQDLSEAIQNGRGNLPLDASLGKATLVMKGRKSLSAYLKEGGEVGYVILALGLLAVSLSLFKVFDIARFSVVSPAEVDALLKELTEGNAQAASSRAAALRGAAGEMLQVGVKYAEKKRVVLEELLFERVLKAKPQAERFLPFLSITAAAAPLLGLLGTVVGMIETFELIAIFGTGDAKSLSSGISEALITTALGLIVAIPILIVHGMLSRMAKRKLSLMEQAAIAFINGVFVGEKKE